MPPTPYWNGERLPTTEPGQIYLFYPDLERRGEFVLALVDYEKATIPFAVRTRGEGAGGILNKLDLAAQFAGGRQPTPPQPVHPWNLPSALIEWARVAAPDKIAAELGGVCEQ